MDQLHNRILPKTFKESELTFQKTVALAFRRMLVFPSSKVFKF